MIKRLKKIENPILQNDKDLSLINLVEREREREFCSLHKQKNPTVVKKRMEEEEHHQWLKKCRTVSGW